jgi:hypothetical protein
MNSNDDWVVGDIPEELAKTIFRVRVDLPGRKLVIERDFKADLKIDYDLLEEQLEQNPATFAFWSSVLAEQRFVVAKNERLLARRRAKVCEKAREIAGEDGAKLHKYILDEIVEGDDEILKLQTRLMMANRTLSKLFGIVDALRMKSEHLRSLAGFKRQEMRDS